MRTRRVPCPRELGQAPLRSASLALGACSRGCPARACADTHDGGRAHQGDGRRHEQQRLTHHFSDNPSQSARAKDRESRMCHACCREKRARRRAPRPILRRHARMRPRARRPGPAPSAERRAPSPQSAANRNSGPVSSAPRARVPSAQEKRAASARKPDAGRVPARRNAGCPRGARRHGRGGATPLPRLGRDDALYARPRERELLYTFCHDDETPRPALPT